MTRTDYSVGGAPAASEAVCAVLDGAGSIIVVADGTVVASVGIAAVAAIAGTLINTMNADVMNLRFLWVVLGLVRGLTPTTPNAAA